MTSSIDQTTGVYEIDITRDAIALCDGFAKIKGIEVSIFGKNESDIKATESIRVSWKGNEIYKGIPYDIEFSEQAGSTKYLSAAFVKRTEALYGMIASMVRGFFVYAIHKIDEEVEDDTFIQ